MHKSKRLQILYWIKLDVNHYCIACVEVEQYSFEKYQKILNLTPFMKQGHITKFTSLFYSFFANDIKPFLFFKTIIFLE